jgi:hypothetical protein
MIMKKAYLLIAALMTYASAGAQTVVYLTGSSYFQSFDNVASGLPAGWEIDSAASTTSKGFPIAFDISANNWNNTTGRGKNYAAKAGFTSYSGTPASAQSAATNRAMGLRQNAGLDKQVAFTVTIAQTLNLSNFNLAFNLQSLDSSSSRISAWVIQYGIGSNPTSFISVSASATNGLATGGNTFKNSIVTASFGSALDSMSGPVVIRVIAQAGTTGSGNRASTAIDSFTLSWTGSPLVYQPQMASLWPANNASNVPAGAVLKIRFDKNVTGGAGNIYIRNITDQTTIAKAASSSDVTVAGDSAIIANAGLVPGKAYYVTFDTNAFKSGGYTSFGLADSTSWTFTTVMPVVTVTSLSETFDASCAGNTLPAGWSRENIQGAGQQWGCYVPGPGASAAMQMNGYQAGNNVNEDWLITPRINLSSRNGQLSFMMQKSFTGTEPDVLVSQDYAGNGDPTTATWTSLNIPMTVADTGAAYKMYMANIGSLGLTPFYLAFKYLSTTTDAYRVRLDSVVLTTAEGLGSVQGQANNMPVYVLGRPRQGNISLVFNASEAGTMRVHMYDLFGRLVVRQSIQSVKGANKVNLEAQSLQDGMYIIQVGNGKEQGVTRVFLQ